MHKEFPLIVTAAPTAIGKGVQLPPTDVATEIAVKFVVSVVP